MRMSNKILIDELRGRYSIADLNRESGVARSTIWRWEQGIHKPNVRTLERIEGAARRLESRSNG